MCNLPDLISAIKYGCSLPYLLLITCIMIQRECQKGKSGSSQLAYDKKIKTICNPGKNYAAVWDIYAAYDIPE